MPSIQGSRATAPAVPGPEEILEGLEDAALYADRDGAIQFLNDAAAHWIGVSPEVLRGLSYDEWLRSAQEHLTGASPPLTAPGHPEAEIRERAIRIGLPRHTYDRTSRPVRDATGVVLGRLEVFRDLTELVREQEERDRQAASCARQLEHLESELQQVEKFKMELTANVTHDLRTPLASIKASVSGLLAGDVAYDPASLRETLTLIEEETDRLQRRVQNLLSMSRMESGGAALSRDWTDIADVIASALESMRSIRGDREVRLDLPDDLPLLLADHDQLQIAVRNLIENAFLYAPPDSPVEVCAGVSLGQMRVRVRDYGPGLMPDEFERVFEKFYRGRAARRTPGTGLGLPICRGIAEAHGGRLWAEHAPGGGVVFVLSAPLEEEAPSAVESGDLPADGARAGGDRTGAKKGIRAAGCKSSASAAPTDLPASEVA